MKTRVVWLTAFLVAGCNLQLGGLGSPTPTGSLAPLADDAVVFSWEVEGGRCPQTVCYNARSFRVDGRFDAVDGPDTSKRSGKIDSALVLALRREIAKADFKALHQTLDDDTRCKRVLDGGDLTWVFTTGNSKETFKACSIIVKGIPVFEAASKLLGAAGDALMAERSPAPVSATRSPFRGVWTVADDPNVKGPIAQNACAKFRRWVFSPAADGNEGVQVAVTDANAGFTRGYDSEQLTVKAGTDSGDYVLTGQRTVPGPTDAPSDEPITYKLTYDAARHIATGTRTLGTGKAEPFTLVETTAAAECPATSPTPSPTSSATPTAVPSATSTALPSAPPTAAPPAQPADRVVVIGRYGGLCPPGVTCGQETAFQRDGRYVTTSGAKELGAGKVSAALVDALIAEIARADFAALKAKPFTGTCPTAYDGQETTYSFTTPGGLEKLSACQYDLPPDHPLFKATQALENARQEQLE